MSNLHPIGAITSLWRDFPRLKLWSCAVFLLHFTFSGLIGLYPIYTTYRFGWSPQQIGFYAGAMAVISVVVYTAGVGPLVRWLGERRAALVASGIQLAGMMGACLAGSGAGFWLASAVIMISTMGGPIQTAMMNHLVGDANRGRLSGMTRSLYSCASAAAPASFAALYAVTGQHGASLAASGAPFLAAGVLTAIGGLALLGATRPTAN